MEPKGNGASTIHAYTLAKDHCAHATYNGPHWAPFNLWHQCEFGAPGPNPQRTKECAKILLSSPGTSDLWALIAERYARPDNIAATLPVRCAEYLDHWHITPKVTPGEHQNARQKLARHAAQLAIELARFFDRWDYDDPAPINFTQLLTEAEQESMCERIRHHNHTLRNLARMDAGASGLEYSEYTAGLDPSQPVTPLNPARSTGDGGHTMDLILDVVPDLPDMLRRISTLFADDARLAPLQRPHSDNAERNFFARNLIRYFLREHGGMSPTIVARITSMFFAQGISDNEVSKQADYLPDGRRFPWQSETSP